MESLSGYAGVVSSSVFVGVRVDLQIGERSDFIYICNAPS
jgi:hypothetical protein